MYQWRWFTPYLIPGTGNDILFENRIIYLEYIIQALAQGCRSLVTKYHPAHFDNMNAT